MKSDTIPSLPQYRVLFVCLGNICRSPAAEGMARHLSSNWKTGSPPVWDSAGTMGWHEGSSPDARMREAGRRRGVNISGKARALRKDDFEKFDLIVTMDDDNLRETLAMAPNAAARAKVFPMVAFSRREPRPSKVPDPYYGGPEGFEEVLDILQDACGNLIEFLQQRQTQCS